MAVRSSHVRRSSSGGSAASRFVIWFALLGGGLAWSLHLLLSYAVAEFGCLSGLGEKQVGGLTVVAWLLLAVSAGALALAAAATMAAIRLRRGRPGERKAVTADAQTLAFSGQLAFVTNVAFTLVIAVQSVPIVYFLQHC